MGIRLIVEVMDHWQDLGLTAGERDDLIVIAENANEGTRETRGSIHEPYILRRVNKSAASWRIAINRLMKKKVLEYAVHDGREVRGHTGQRAVYRIPVLCPDPPHDGHLGQCTRAKKVTSQVAHPDDDVTEEGYPSANPPVDEVGNPSANPVDGVGYLTATSGFAESYREGYLSANPYPSTPSTPSTTAAGKPAATRKPPKPRKPSEHPVADDLTAAFWDVHKANCAQSFIAVRSVIRTAIGNGVERDILARALDRVARDGKPISGGTLQFAIGELRGSNGRRPYTNPDDQSEYDEEIS